MQCETRGYETRDIGNMRPRTKKSYARGAEYEMWDLY